MRGTRKRWRVFAVAALLLLALIVWLGQPWFSGAAFIADLSGTQRWPRRLLPVRLHAVTNADVTVPTRHGAVPARITRAAGSRRTVVVFPGVHSGGVDEPRLAALTARLAATGATVVSVPLPELRVYRITPASTDAIEDAVGWTASQRDLAPSGTVGVVGVSFSGGIAIVAAGRLSLRDRISAVISIGGHADLPRVMTYLCTGTLPGGATAPAPHDYGAAIMLRAAIPALVPPEQVAPMTDALVAFLDASSDAGTHPARAAERLATAHALADRLDDPARTLMQLTHARDVAAVGPKLLPLVETLGGNAALSPDRSPAPHVPVYILHGRDDTVIPSFEASELADYLRRQGNQNTHVMLTPLLSHADVQSNVSLAEGWRLVRFWTKAWSDVR
jgi:pimeloyl-ACP methyl ester carboxylesterase